MGITSNLKDNNTVRPIRTFNQIGFMNERQSTDSQILQEMYVAFNERNIDAALGRMTPEVKWPRAFKGGFVHGPEAVRAYWTEQWSEIDPKVYPASFSRKSDSSILVEVHQVVRDLSGEVLADDVVGHVFTFEDGLIDKMEVCDFSGEGGTDSSTPGVAHSR